ncbi:DUF2851 family protein [Mangrovimonas aestuarii]|uniref:DUF2851 family protein n=1 Tax=Mangrovimonas aestuarii TaxID=3018443 RepID=UPI00237878EB|nr:DUF2851 family protein [Mangrovimonas aestuarii]
MQEEFLHYLWKHKAFHSPQLKTAAGELLEIVSTGQHNHDSGPDFFNAKLRVGNQLWAGNVEIHINSGDWYVHNHEQDVAYNNVILHVVWNHDTEVYRKNNDTIPTLELKDQVDKEILDNYHNLFLNVNQWINCERDINSVDGFTMQNWLERLYVERLQRKSIVIEGLLKSSKNNWEAVSFCMLAKAFGLRVNREAFLSLAQSLDFSVIRKVQNNIFQLEALFLGQAGILEKDNQDVNFVKVKKEYVFLKRKFQLDNTRVIPIQFFRLRPHNFPTIRLSQLAVLYGSYPNLFSQIMDCKSIESFYELFTVQASEYWDNHFNFGKVSKPSKKTTTKSFIDLLLINTVIPLQFAYMKAMGKGGSATLLEMVRQLASEKNTIVEIFQKLRPFKATALESQALLELKTEYCDKNKCLQCAVGNALLQGFD